MDNVVIVCIFFFFIIEMRLIVLNKDVVVWICFVVVCFEGEIVVVDFKMVVEVFGIVWIIGMFFWSSFLIELVEIFVSNEIISMLLFMYFLKGVSVFVIFFGFIVRKRIFVLVSNFFLLWVFLILYFLCSFCNFVLLEWLFIVICLFLMIFVCNKLLIIVLVIEFVLRKEMFWIDMMFFF